MHVDLPEAQLRGYRAAVTEPADFDDFWAGTLAEARRHDAAPRADRRRERRWRRSRCTT